MTSAFDEDALRNWLVDYLVTNIGCSPDEIDFDAPLNDLAVGSSDAVVLTGELSELLGRTVSPVEFWQYPTINALAKFLTGGEVEPIVEDAAAAGGEYTAGNEPIAVIGLGLRLPGGADMDVNIEGPDAYWQFLTEGRSAVREVPADRWETFSIDSPEAAAALAGTTRWGSFLRDVDAFDAEFFEISPSEADKMDPQQRLLLEVTQEALEHAGIQAHTLRHSQTGVFAAACLGEYGYLSTVDLGDVDSWSGTGGALSIIANRVSYYFDLRGPSMTIDTACSSSLVTIHLACQSLRSGDSNLALAAGVNLLLSPAVTRSFDQLEAMSKTGQCHAFDASADGFVRGEGCGVAVLKRLSDAQRDGDRILAVIRGSAVNQDGRSNGLMAPNPAAQMAVLRSAYAAAGVEPREVDYVEAHGTGTLLGDPIEARALGTVLGKGRPAERPLLLGAVKSNLGHLEAAAGIAGFAKAVLALQHQEIPANLGYQKPNPHIPFDNLRLKVVDAPTEWAPAGRPRRAGISSFGFGGTNAHVVIEEPPVAAPPPAHTAEPAVTTLVVSGRTPERIASQAATLAEWMVGPGAEASLTEIAHTLNHHRSQHAKFATVAARDRAQAIAGLQALGAGQSAPGVVGPHVGACARGTVFVFSGQGSQWAGMGQRLLADEPAFAAALAEIEPVFVEQVGFSLYDVIAEGRPVSGDAEVQPVLMGLQLALTELWRSYGVHPDAVIGHSMGEVTAAVVGGALSVADGLKVIAHRSQIMSRLAGQGAVALVELAPDAAEAFVADYPSVEVAGYVSPRQTVVAGLPAEVDAVIAAVAAQDRFARRVNMEVASHTALMDPVLPDLRDALAGITPRTPTIPFLSTVVDAEEPVLDADYWVANVRQPVRFSQAVATAAQEIGTFIEVSPNPILTYAVADTLGTAHHHSLGTLVKDGDDTLSFHTTLNATHTTHPPETVHEAHQGAAQVALPTTPWHRTHHWAIRKRASSGASAPRPGTVLGSHTAVAGPQPGHLWQARLTPQARPYPHAHRFAGVEIVPLSVLLQTLAQAAAHTGASAVADVRFEFPIAVDTPRVVQVYADADTVTISSATGEDTEDQHWVRHVSARISRDDIGPAAPAVTDASGYDPAALPELHNAWGIDGMAYPWTVESHTGERGESRTEVTFADAPDAPLAAVLDAAVNLGRLVDASTPGLMVPSSADAVVFAAMPAPRGTIVTRSRGRDGDALVVDITVTAPAGAPIVDLRGLRYTPVDVDEQAEPDAAPRRIAHRLDWQPWATDTPPSPLGPVAVVGTGEVAAALRALVDPAEVADARHVVYVAEPDPAQSDQDTAVRLTTEVAELVGTLADRGPRDPATLWILTRGVHEAASDEALSQSGLWGLAGVVGAEQPQLWGGLIDLPAGSDPQLSSLLDVLSTPIKSVAVWRDGQVRTSVLAEITDEPVRETLRCRPDAAYLITGGLGVLGLLTADWLADRGARRLVLAGRTALPSRRDWDAVSDPDVRGRIAAIRALELRGVSVDTVAVDIADRDAVGAVLDRRDADGAPPIRGVVHAAGMTEAQLLTEIEADRVHGTVWPKVAGARVLDALFPPGSLDFLYLAASAGAVFGIPGQGAYAAGNAYLDALARSRHARGDNTVSLDWVAWRGLGFGGDAQVVVSELERVGSRPVGASEAFAAWDHVTRFDIDQVVMAPMQSAEDAAAVTSDAHRPAAPTRNWSAMSAEELLAELRGGLRGILATELRLPADDVATDRPFAEMGLNSVMAMSIRREIERLVGLELSATMLFNHPTVDTFATYLAQQLVPDLDVGGDDEVADDDAGDSLLDSLFDSVESN
ncbi:type I polyketide synthase [Mycolicibacterium rufum]|uniref:Type I polyketide synthase n=1 Tax=Mycolicibacterium rufum TaxID=318424 RepID=A0ABY3U4E2_9MYCO|nr:type I polyketide synthase [Mycolicibacterium rufum]KGI68355.1 polyketide synthase [Mycolicibacterium rufum]ULP34451.1 type I polyketide synthase [Mycolicibacterium rufum]